MNKVAAYILTLNEEVNISKCLESVQWVDQIFVVDSFSVDNTESKASDFGNVFFIKNKFIGLSHQHNFALSLVEQFKYVIRLDADWEISDQASEELRYLFELDLPNENSKVWYVPFEFQIASKPVREALYGDVPAILHNPSNFYYVQDGHTERLRWKNPVTKNRLDARFIHNDLKPIDRFFQSQIRYSSDEMQRIAGLSRKRTKSLTFKAEFVDFLRRNPFLAFAAVGIWLGLIRLIFIKNENKKMYLCQRLIAELFVSARILEAKIELNNSIRQTRPTNSPIDYHDRLAESWSDKYKSSFFKARYSLFERLIRKYYIDENICFDLGCGSGDLGEIFSNANITFDSLEPSYNMFIRAKNRGLSRNLFNQSLEEFRVHSAYQIVIASSVFEYVAEPDRFFETVSRLLSIEGYLIFSVANKLSFIRLLQSVCIKAGAKNFGYLKYSKGYTRGNIVALTHRHEFEVSEVKSIDPVLPSIFGMFCSLSVYVCKKRS